MDVYSLPCLCTSIIINVCPDPGRRGANRTSAGMEKIQLAPPLFRGMWGIALPPCRLKQPLSATLICAHAAMAPIGFCRDTESLSPRHALARDLPLVPLATHHLPSLHAGTSLSWSCCRGDLELEELALYLV